MKPTHIIITVSALCVSLAAFGSKDSSRDDTQAIQDLKQDPRFAIVDTDKDGAISREELMVYQAQRHQQTNNFQGGIVTFAILDKDSDGVLSPQELNEAR